MSVEKLSMEAMDDEDEDEDEDGFEVRIADGDVDSVDVNGGD